MNYKCNRKRNGVTIRIYRCSSRICSQCSMLSGCTTHKRKRRELWISEVYQQERAMKKKLSSVKGRAIYDRRKVMVEPVFGNMKFNMGFGRFVLRGLRKVRTEFLLMCMAHNLKKMSMHWSMLKPRIESVSRFFIRMYQFSYLILKNTALISVFHRTQNIKLEYAW